MQFTAIEHPARAPQLHLEAFLRKENDGIARTSR
jgi:hypothetical protein